MSDIPLGVRQEGAALAAAGAENTAVRSADQARYARAQAERREAAGRQSRDTLQDWASETQAKQQIKDVLGEKTRPIKTKAETAEGSVRELAGLKFEEMNPIQQARIREAALVALDQIPEFSSYKAWLDSHAASGLRDGLIDDALKTLDKNGDIGRALRTVHREFFSRQRPQSQELEEAATALDAKKNEQTQNTEAISGNSSASTENADKLRSFSLTGRGTKGYELNQANSQIDGLFTEISRDNVSLLQGMTPERLREYFERRGDLDSDISNLERTIALRERDKALQGQAQILTALKRQLLLANQAKTLIGRYGGKYDALMQPVNVLNAEKQGLINERDKLAADGLSLKARRAQIENEIREVQKKVNSLKSREEKEYVGEIENLLQEGMKNLYQTNLDRVTAEDISVQDKLIKAETDPTLKAIRSSINEGRWREIDRVRFARVRRGKFLGKGKIEKFKSGQIKLDMRTFADLGQDAFWEKLARENLGFPSTGALTPPQQEMLNKVLSSEKFKTDIGPKASRDLLAAAMKTDNLDDDDMDKILDTDYGAQLVTEAEVRHKELIDETKKRFNFVGPTKEFIKKNKKLGWWLLALPLLTTPAGLVGLGGFAVYKLAKANGGHKEAA